MTTEKAIQLLHRLQDEQFDGIHGDERREALEMAVRALSGEGDTIYRRDVIDSIEKMQMPIMRSEFSGDQFIFTGMSRALQAIKELPSAQPEITEDDVKEYCRKRCLIVVTSDFYDEMYRRWVITQPGRKPAKWVKTEIGWKCSNCTLCTNIKGKTEFNFCPNCGAEMRKVIETDYTGISKALWDKVRGESDETD